MGSKRYSHHFLGDFPSFKWKKIKKAIPDQLDGWNVLDIGCNAGFILLNLQNEVLK
ncbi:MAG: Methyltransferase [Flavobacteriaceae bacterium FS1-H7996/R]|nr:MAG: Methyltransferase [Flavobacteriaceae bacterium FS1-H7996/R]